MASTQFFKDRLLYLIIIYLGFQQFPIIRAGGSLKIYEILGFMLMVYNLMHFQFSKRSSNIAIYSFIFLVVIPITSYIYSSLFFEYPYAYYMRWPDYVKDFKTSYYLFPLMQLFYLAMNYSVFNSLLTSVNIYENFNKLLKAAIFLGTIISIYSLFALWVVDFIHFLPEIIQNKHNNGNRSTGLSQEPGTYVLYQTWICLFLWYSKKLYRPNLWYILLTINVVSLVLTQSTPLWGLLLAIILSVFVFKGSSSKKFKTIFGLVFALFAIYGIVQFFGYQDSIENMFFTKVQTFVQKNGHKTGDSGATRKYLSDIGFRVFSDNPFLGVGYGRSMYYMYLYQFKVGISVFGEPMNHGSTPLNMFSIILSEMGSVGMISFCIFYFAMMKKFWVNRNKSDYHKMFLIGGFVEFVTLFSLYTPHALFLWAYLGLGLGYIKYFDRKTAVEDSTKRTELAA